MKIYGSIKSLYDDWEEKHNEQQTQIDALKKKRTEAKTNEEHAQIQFDLQEVLNKSLMTFKFLSDLGPLAYAEEQAKKQKEMRR